jgi:hypothetical protein
MSPFAAPLGSSMLVKITDKAGFLCGQLKRVRKALGSPQGQKKRARRARFSLIR